jgi:hypothetical protein
VTLFVVILAGLRIKEELAGENFLNERTSKITA